MIIETRLYHNTVLIRDRIMVSELELEVLSPEAREAVIQTAKRICAARCVQKWRRHMLETKQ